MKSNYNEALDKLPLCVNSIDYQVHITVKDLVDQVIHEINLYEEGEETDIQTKAQLQQCRRYLARYCTCG